MSISASVSIAGMRFGPSEGRPCIAHSLGRLPVSTPAIAGRSHGEGEIACVKNVPDVSSARKVGSAEVAGAPPPGGDTSS